MDIVQLVFSAVDVPFVIGIIVAIQLLKKVFKLKPKLWILVLILFGFVAALIKVNPFDWRAFIVQGFVYIAASEFVYQSYKSLMASKKKK